MTISTAPTLDATSVDPTDVYVIRIDPDGTVTPIPDTRSALTAARELFDDTPCVFTCHPVNTPEAQAAGFPIFEHVVVGVCHDFAYTVTPIVNPKAWALYGRSPIAGPAVFARDDRQPLDPDWIENLATDWCREPTMRTVEMIRVGADHGLAWPEQVTS